MANVPQRLKELRKNSKLTQAQVANFLNITESAYGYYEQGRNDISISSVQKLAEKYGVSVAYILGETDNPTPLSQQDKEEEEFQAFANNPELNVFYKELPDSNEEAVERLREIWEIIKHDYKK